jgi:hypothetical protein
VLGGQQDRTVPSVDLTEDRLAVREPTCGESPKRSRESLVEPGRAESSLNGLRVAELHDKLLHVAVFLEPTRQWYPSWAPDGRMRLQ